MNGDIYILLMTLIISAVTIIIRFLPFAVFRNKTPQPILYLGEVLPYAIMGMLVVYCLRNVSFVLGSHGIPETISVAAVVILHKLKHNMLLSVCSGTVLYILLVQFVF